MGGSGNDSIYGNGGADLIEGGSGNDLLEGDGQADTFRFAVGSGVDTIGDFVRGSDLIDLKGYGGITGFAGLTIIVTSGSSVIDLGSANGGSAGVDVLTVEDVVGLAATDFVFA